MPSTRREFWEAKLQRNRARDAEVRSMLHEAEWRSLVIWECALKGKSRLNLEEIMDFVSTWIRGEETEGEIFGRPA